MTDYEGEQEMEVEALQAILMNDIAEIPSEESGLGTSARCFQITVSPMDDDEDEPTDIPVRLAVIFAHTPTYPDEPPHLKVRRSCAPSCCRRFLKASLHRPVCRRL